jgi:negative regulator of sigma E activity
MTQSLSQMSYKGTLVHIKNNDVITLKVSHTIENGEEVERVERLNKNGKLYSRKVRDYSLSQLPKFGKKMQSVYSFDLGNIKKVAARPCQLVIARPKDRMRYLQKFCVDTKTSLLLDYTIIDKSHKPIEQFMFTSVEILSNGVAPKKATADVKQVIANSALSLSSSSTKKATNLAWSLKKTPKGFSLRKGPSMQGETVAEHYILSDGLSSVSIFISKKVPNSKQTGTHSGALNVVTYYKDNFAITLVGAVPKSTLKDIFNNLRHKAK